MFGNLFISVMTIVTEFIANNCLGFKVIISWNLVDSSKSFYGNVNNHRNRVTGMQAPMPVVGIVDSSESSPRRVKFSHFNINVNVLNLHS